MKPRLPNSLLIVLFCLMPVSASALEAEYYTYGGFDAVVSGFQRLALIFSDGGYKGLYFSVIVMALLFGAAAMTALALGLVPFLALFIPTPLLGKALSVMVGFFIWLTAWGVTDAILHQFLMDYGSRALEGLRQHGGGTGFGMDAFYFMPNETLKILGMFGTVRMSGMMLATVMTGLLVKFGGHTLAKPLHMTGRHVSNNT